MNNKSFSGNFMMNMIYQNPIFVQVLGICSTLAVTNNLTNTMVMTFAVTFATGLSSFTLSAFRDLIPFKVRMIAQTLVIAFFVIIVDLVIKAYLPEISKSLAAYVGLILTNCILMGRAEAFAQSNTPLISMWDGITSGLGYMAVLMVVAFFRELMGFGTLFGFPIFQLVENGGWFTPWLLAIQAPSAFFLLAVLVWIFRGRLEALNAARGGK
jgi:Na+-transporting NADH:ubiquinone oxidoreductase subunit D